MNQYDERAFETYIEETLFSKNSWTKGSNRDWDKENALFPRYIFKFIQDTQEDLWTKLEGRHSSSLGALLLEALGKELEIKGTIYILRHGFKFEGETIRTAFFKPTHGLNEETVELYKKNSLYVTRQVPCHPNDSSTIDLVFALNGLPVATCELKNPSTGQNWRHAILQYKKDRRPNAPLFKFKRRAIVHFAADTDEVHMATRLTKKDTRFLPFNRGSDPEEPKCGAGNPWHPSGHRTGYFWEDILSRDVFLDILGRYVFIEKEEKKYFDKNRRQYRETKEHIIFPRFHQWDGVSKVVESARREGVGHNYLIQHSAGSGKTKSISWLSHRLSTLHDEKDNKIFDCVLVITDRKVLDGQLQDAVYQIEHTSGVVEKIDKHSRQLTEALAEGKKIVITTLQKFPFVLKGLLRVAGADEPKNATEIQRASAREWEAKIAKRKYAIILDEAHSGYSGESTRELKEMLGGHGSESTEDEHPLDWEDRIGQVMSSRGRQKNLSFFAFTATPKGKTLEIFGRKNASGKYGPFHIYSMRQAIEEKFILDVVKNYTVYDVFFKLLKSAEDDPDLPKQKAVTKLAQFAFLHPTNIEQKTKIIVEHFKNHIMHRLDGRAKAMVTASSRLQAVKYMKSFQRYIREQGYDEIRPLVAFSGTVSDKDIPYTESKMNKDSQGKSIGESQLPEKFDEPEYQILLVANKYLTGFDQPLLCAMYIDKKLSGVQAVQTLSRLNRMVPGKESPFVLDFVNKVEDIYGAFKPYYDATSLQESTDPHRLEELKFGLDQAQIYYQSEVEAFAKIFYKPKSGQESVDHARLESYLNPAADRFKMIQNEDKKSDFRDDLISYVNLYSFVSQIIPYSDQSLEMLFSYGKFLLPKLKINDPNEEVDIKDDVELQYFRIQRNASASINLDDGSIEEVKTHTTTKIGKRKEEELPLSDIIEILNERFATDFTEADRLFLQQVADIAAGDEGIKETALANPLDKFKIGIKKTMESLMIDSLNKNDRIVTKYLDDREFQDAVFSVLAKSIFDDING